MGIPSSQGHAGEDVFVFGGFQEILHAAVVYADDEFFENRAVKDF